MAFCSVEDDFDRVWEETCVEVEKDAVEAVEAACRCLVVMGGLDRSGFVGSEV